jgi:hypothetical protein
MVRSAAALVAVLILPSFAQAQEPVGTHTVVKDDTLWDLAQRYYSNPFEWRVIWNANRDVVEDPNWIYPAEVLVIPGLPGDAAAEPTAEEPMTPEPMEEEPEMVEGVPSDLVPFGLRQARPVADATRTIFYNDTAGVRRSMVAAVADRQTLAVSPDRVYSAPWLIGLQGDPENQGWITGFAERGDRASTIRSFDQIRISMPTPARVGAYLQLFRVDATIENVGQVVIPTGVAEVSTIGNGEVVAIVIKEYERIQAGDWVGPLPGFSLEPGDEAQPVSGGSEAMIMGFEGEQTISDIGHVAFLDLGSDDGISIGDEFVLFGDAIPTARDGSLQVIGVRETTAAARVMSMRDNVFRQGVVVRLVRKMN